METIVKKLYEGMFLVDSAEVAADWDGVNAAIKNILEKADAEIVSTRKWDDRKLAYEINGKAKGTYVLCYFRARGEQIRSIERDVRLSERIMRVLILCADGREQENIEKDTDTLAAQAEMAEQSVSELRDESIEPEQQVQTGDSEQADIDEQEKESG